MSNSIKLILFFFLFQIVGSSQDVWNTKNNNMNNIRSLGFTPEFVVGVCDCGGIGTVVKTWSLSDGEADSLFRARIQEICISNNGNYLAIRSFKDSIMLQTFFIEGKKWLWQYTGSHYNSIAFSEDDEYLIAINENAIEEFEVQSGDKNILKTPLEDKLSDYIESKKRALRQKLSPDGKYMIIWNDKINYEWDISFLFLFSASPNPNIAVWDILENKLISEIQKPLSKIVSVAFSPDGKKVFLGCEDEKIRVWSLLANKIIKDFEGDPSYIDVSNRNNLLGIGGDHLRILNSLTFTLIKDFGKVGDKVGRLSEWSFSSDGKYFALEVEGILYLHETNTWEVLWSIPTCP